MVVCTSHQEIYVINEIFQVYSMDRECGESHPLVFGKNYLEGKELKYMTVSHGLSFSLRTLPSKKTPGLNSGLWSWEEFLEIL